MSIETLERALAPPSRAVETGDHAAWDSVDESLGVNLPGDYKQLVSRYGTGCIDDFLWVLNPFTQNDNLNLVIQADAKLDALRQLRDEFGVGLPYPLFIEGEGLYPWAFTDNGDVLYLLIRKGLVVRTVVIGDSGGNEWQEFDGTVTEFLTALVARRIDIGFFPKEFPSDSPTYCCPVPPEN